MAYREVSAKDIDFSNAPTYRKTETVLKSNVEVVTTEQEVVTTIAGKEETKNTAHVGDHIITGIIGERYVLKAEKFAKLYEEDPTDSARYISKNRVQAIRLEEPVEIQAPWGEQQRADAGAFVVKSVITGDVYLIAEEAFLKSFAKVA